MEEREVQTLGVKQQEDVSTSLVRSTLSVKKTKQRRKTWKNSYLPSAEIKRKCLLTISNRHPIPKSTPTFTSS
jgi:hypothetical protein